MSDLTNPSIEAAVADAQSLAVNSHLESDRDSVANCRWEDWLVASGESVVNRKIHPET